VNEYIQTAYQEIELPLDITDTPDNMAEVGRCYEARLRGSLPGYYRRHAEVMIQQIQDRTFEMAVPLPIQVWKL
jgi:hypothetical protein